MNVIVSNKYQSMLQNLQIETLKNINGVFTVDEIIDEFKVIFFQKMILDITAIKDYKKIENLQKLAISLDADKIILVLDADDSESSTSNFQSKLISMGIYNFTKDLEGINYLYNHPNTYRDVAHIQQLDMVNGASNQGAKTVFQTEIQRETVYLEKNGPRIIGIKNVTKQSGATTLIYMMLNQLSKKYKTVAVELEKKDFTYFPSKKMFSKKGAELGNFIAEHSDKDVILVDLNDSTNTENLCSDVIYLIEPSIIKLGRYMLLNPKGMTPYKNKKVVLNQSLLSQKDVLDFEVESKLKIFFNMPPLDEREKNIYILNVFLAKLGFNLQEDVEAETKKKGLFG